MMKYYDYLLERVAIGFDCDVVGCWLYGKYTVHLALFLFSNEGHELNDICHPYFESL